MMDKSLVTCDKNNEIPKTSIGIEKSFLKETSGKYEENEIDYINSDIEMIANNIYRYYNIRSGENNGVTADTEINKYINDITDVDVTPYIKSMLNYYGNNFTFDYLIEYLEISIRHKWIIKEYGTSLDISFYDIKLAIENLKAFLKKSSLNYYDKLILAFIDSLKEKGNVTYFFGFDNPTAETVVSLHNLLKFQAKRF